jgi:hypothetical protein
MGFVPLKQFPGASRRKPASYGKLASFGQIAALGAASVEQAFPPATPTFSAPSPRNWLRSVKAAIVGQASWPVHPGQIRPHQLSAYPFRLPELASFRQIAEWVAQP